MMTMAERAPVPSEERVHLLDTLRAIALYGVISFNMIGMSAVFVVAELLPKAGALDLAFLTFDLFLIQGKARATFALLFGIGFGLMMDRMTTRGHRFGGFYLRRMTMLLAIGLFDIVFLFWGDILVLYAIMGMVLLLFRHWSDRALLWLGLALIVVPSLLLGTAELLTGYPLPNWSGDSADALSSTLRPSFQGSSFSAFIAANLRYYVGHYRAETNNVAVYDLSVLGLFIIGLYTARKRVLIDVERWRPFLRRVAWTCLPLGFLFNIVYASRRLGVQLEGAAYAAVTTGYVGLPIMAIGYVALFTLLLSDRASWVHRALSPAGRMALTCYLFANAIGAFITYGWGIGMLGQMNIAALNLLGLAVYAGLCLFSAFWLSRFRFGPAEWVWRSLTYGDMQPMRRKPVATVHRVR